MNKQTAIITVQCIYLDFNLLYAFLFYYSREVNSPVAKNTSGLCGLSRAQGKEKKISCLALPHLIRYPALVLARPTVRDGENKCALRIAERPRARVPNLGQGSRRVSQSVDRVSSVRERERKELDYFFACFYANDLH